MTRLSISIFGNVEFWISFCPTAGTTRATWSPWIAWTACEYIDLVHQVAIFRLVPGLQDAVCMYMINIVT